ncbi:MAG: TlyA family RNA methyltransferase [Ruminococcaceae bacterium]|nr:TlyA family RNA methyltransferase [Oscillospiraceae bacterium]
MRADIYITVGGFAKSRTMAQKLIGSGAVSIDGKRIGKPSEEIGDGEHTVEISEIDEMRYVSRGGLKLEAALDFFGLSPNGLIALDVGASTGGFTDCLLKRGAKLIFAVDSGVGQLHTDLLADPRVISLEKTNARTLTPSSLAARGNIDGFDGHVDIAVMDVSFISQTVIIPALSFMVRNGGWLISLIKPQFEVGRCAVGKGGIVKSPKDRKNAVENVKKAMAGYGFRAVGIIDSPIMGGDGNHEYIGYFVKEGNANERN